VLYNSASNAGKLWFLDILLSILYWNIGNTSVAESLSEPLSRLSTSEITSRVEVVAMLLGKLQCEPKEALQETAERVKILVSQLDGIERAYLVARLYPQLARLYATFGELDNAMELIKETLKALEELRITYGENKASTEKKLRPYLELKQVRPDLERELKELSHYVYHHAAIIYMNVDELDKAMNYGKKACDEFAKTLNKAYYEVMSCGLLPRLRAVRDGTPSIKASVKEFEEIWQRASQSVGRLGAEAKAIALGRYVVALASAGRLGEAKEILENWSPALEEVPLASALTYGVLSLFDERYLEQAMRYLPWLAMHKYGKDVANVLAKATRSDKLFLSALVGLAYCKRGEEGGLKQAKESARVGSRIKGIAGRLFAELYKALENATMDNCITEEVLGAVYKLYYLHV